MVKWKDNKFVYVASNFVGIETEHQARRFNKVTKSYEMINRPMIISKYNAGMGGVDKLDQCIAYYRAFIKSRKWTLRIFSHFLDFSVVSAWFEYQRDSENSGRSKKACMDLLAFRTEIINNLLYVGKASSSKRGRPTNSPIPPKIRGNVTEFRPSQSIATDLYDHMPYMDDKKEATRCKRPTCKGRTHMVCDKCNIHLCITKSNDCFREYHRSLKVYIFLFYNIHMMGLFSN